MNQLKKRCVNLINSDPKGHASDFRRLRDIVARSKALYKGEPVPFLLIPKFFNHDDVARFQRLLTDVMAIVDKSVNAYLDNPAVRRYFDFDPKLDELIRVDHGYSTNVPMGRFDVFIGENGDFQFCELNTDGSSAMNEDHVLAGVLVDSTLMRELAADYEMKPFELFDSWVESVASLYRESGGTKPHPFVAIVDILDKGSPVEFEEFKKRFVVKGYPCEIVDAADLTERDGFLHVNGRRVDVVYRRLVTRDLMEHYDDLPDLVRGLGANKTPVIGPLKSQIAHTKKFFAFLHHPDFQRLFTETERDFIRRRVPFTISMADVEDIDHYVENKDDHIVKPVDYYASKGVMAGKNHSADEWRDILEERAGNGAEHVIQRFHRAAPVVNVIFNDDDEPEFLDFNTVTGLFVYDKSFRGVYSRASRSVIISGLHECFTSPSFLVTPKR